MLLDKNQGPSYLFQQREEEMVRQMQDLREEISDKQSSKKESDDLVEKLKEEVHKKDEALGQMEADVNVGALSWTSIHQRVNPGLTG